MASQFLGALATIGGIVFLFLVVSKGGANEAVGWLIAALAIMGGLVLGALGRIQAAIEAKAGQPPRGRLLSILLLLLIAFVTAALVLGWFFYDSGPPKNNPPRPIPVAIPKGEPV